MSVCKYPREELDVCAHNLRFFETRQVFVQAKSIVAVKLGGKGHVRAS